MKWMTLTAALMVCSAALNSADAGLFDCHRNDRCPPADCCCMPAPECCAPAPMCCEPCDCCCQPRDRGCFHGFFRKMMDTERRKNDCLLRTFRLR